jgi:hypothetical protein
MYLEYNKVTFVKVFLNVDIEISVAIGKLLHAKNLLHNPKN